MRKVYILLLLPLLFCCNNEELDSEFTQEAQEIQLIPSQITWEWPSLEVMRYMYYDSIGRVKKYGPPSMGLPPLSTEYDGVLLTDLNIFTNDHGNIYDFYYTGEVLDSIRCNCSVIGIGSINKSWLQYEDNIITKTTEYVTAGFTQIEEFVFEDSEFTKISQITKSDDQGQYLSRLEFVYDGNNNITQMISKQFNEESNSFYVLKELNQTFDDKINPFKYATKLNPIIELYIYPIDASMSYVAVLNRFGNNNVTHQTETFVSLIATDNVIEYDYIYNEQGYPLSYQRTKNEVIVRNYYFDYYPN